MSPASKGKAAESRQPALAEIYAAWTLDCVVQSARAVALDFAQRPRQYKNVSDEAASAVEAMWFVYGKTPNYPDDSQRGMIAMPLVGGAEGAPATDRSAQFHVTAGALRARAWDFSNRQVTTGEDNLRQAFLDDLVPFRSYLETMRDNAVVRNGLRQISAIFGTAVTVLKDPAVAGVFGRPAPEGASWPIGPASFDATGARLVEEVTLALETAHGPVSQSRFLVLQRAAHYGALTITGALAADLAPAERDATDPLITVAYSWKTAIDALAS